MLGDLEGFIFFVPVIYLLIYLAAVIIMKRLIP